MYKHIDATKKYPKKVGVNQDGSILYENAESIKAEPEVNTLNLQFTWPKDWGENVKEIGEG